MGQHLWRHRDHRLEYPDGQAGKAPKDWKDLLDPRWKGKKIGLPVEAFQWYGGMVTYLGDKAGRDFMKALAAQDPQTQQGYTNTSNLLVAGEFPVAITRAHRIEDRAPKARRWTGPRKPIRSSSASIRSVFRESDAPGGGAAVLQLPHLSRRAKPFRRRRIYQFPRRRQSAFPKIDPRRIKHPAPPGSKSQRAHLKPGSASTSKPSALPRAAADPDLQMANSRSSLCTVE